MAFSKSSSVMYGVSALYSLTRSMNSSILLSSAPENCSFHCLTVRPMSTFGGCWSVLVPAEYLLCDIFAPQPVSADAVCVSSRYLCFFKVFFFIPRSKLLQEKGPQTALKLLAQRLEALRSSFMCRGPFPEHTDITSLCLGAREQCCTTLLLRAPLHQCCTELLHRCTGAPLPTN